MQQPREQCLVGERLIPDRDVQYVPDSILDDILHCRSDSCETSQNQTAASESIMPRMHLSYK